MSQRKILFVNLFSLSGIQLVNYIFPLLTIPYITRIIGPDNYGLINFAYSFVNYFILIVNFNFDLSVTREISFNRNNKEKLDKIFYSVIAAKIILFFACSIIFIPFMFISKFQNDVLVFAFSYLVLIGHVFFPTWFYQGMEKLTKLALFNFLFRAFYTVSIFLFIKTKDDFILIPLAGSLTQIILSIVAFLYATKLFNIKYTMPGLDEIKERFIQGRSIFVSSIAVNFYSSTNIVILGLLTANVYVGYFTAANKLINIISSLILLPVSMSFFPHIGNLMNTSKKEGINVLKKLTFILGTITFAASAILFIFSGFIVKLVFGEQFVEAATCLKIISFIPFIIGLSNIFAVQGLLNLKMDKEFLIITFIGAGLSIILNFLLVPYYSEKGTAIVWLITELFITFASHIILLKNDINLFDLTYFKSYLTYLRSK